MYRIYTIDTLKILKKNRYLKVEQICSNKTLKSINGKTKKKKTKLEIGDVVYDIVLVKSEKCLFVYTYFHFESEHSDGARVCQALGKIYVGSYNLY
jgi:translation initiation factor IF-1